MRDKFHLLMHAVDDDLLEEAMTPVKKKRPLLRIGVTAAACLMLFIGLTALPNRTPTLNSAELSSMGYDIQLPKDAEQVRYEIVTMSEQTAAQASFIVHDTKYVYQTVKVQEPQPISAGSNEQVLTWNAGNMDIQLLSSDTSTSVSWYLQDTQTQCYLTADASSSEVLTTAGQILHATGLNVMVAPDDAENVTYDVFLLDGLTVAETTFRLNGISYSYRTAATMEIREDFADISELSGPFENHSTGNLLWCNARLAYTDGGQGKIVWFDLVPGVLYALTMDSNASEDTLLSTANQLFEPVQDDIG